MAEQKQPKVAQVALSWLLHQSAVTSVIIGTKRIEQLDENIGATTIRLTELQTLNEASKLPAEYPGWMMETWSSSRAQQLEASRIR